MAKSQQLLSSSSVPKGFSFTATIPSGDNPTLTTAQIWAASLAKIGVIMNIEQIEATTAQDLYNSEKYTMRLSGWTNDTPDPDELMGVAMDYQPQNGLHSGYHNEEARKLVTAGRAELDPAKRQAIYSQLQEIENKDCPFIYTVEQDRIFAVSPKLTGFAPNSQGKYDFDDVSLKQ